jgi:hypothetical protein
MQKAAIAAGLLTLAACSSAPPSGAGKMTLKDPYWDRVDVEVVVTSTIDCDARGEGFVSSRKIVMRKGGSESFVVPDGAILCWRHDANPKTPTPGLWSGWSKATLMPGQQAETDL